MSLHARLLNDPAFGLVLAVDKPTGATSRDVLNHIQHVFTVHRQQARDPQKLRDPQQLDMPIGGFRATPDAERDGQRKRMSKQQLRELIKIGHGGTLDPLVCLCEECVY